MTFLIVFGIAVVIAILVVKWYTGTIQFGARVTDGIEARYKASPNWKNGQFQNLEHTVMDINPRTLPKILSRQFTGRKLRQPQQPLPLQSY